MNLFQLWILMTLESQIRIRIRLKSLIRVIFLNGAMEGLQYRLVVVCSYHFYKEQDPDPHEI